MPAIPPRKGASTPRPQQGRRCVPAPGNARDGVPRRPANPLDPWTRNLPFAPCPVEPEPTRTRPSAQGSHRDCMRVTVCMRRTVQWTSRVERLPDFPSHWHW